MADLADQLGWCITTKDYLNDLIDEIESTGKAYENMIDELKQNGYFGDIATPLIQNQLQFQSEVESLKNYVADEHLDYIQQQADAVSATLRKLLNK